MGNRVARLATPCFAPPHGARGRRADGSRAADVHTNGAADDGSSIGHILSFDGREGPAFAGAIHGVLLPSNQSTVGSTSGASVLNDQMSFSCSSSFDSSNSFSFRTLQPRQYSGPLEYSTSPSTSATTSGVSVSRQPPRTDEQILADLYATRHRRQFLQASNTSPLLGGLRRAVASLLCASPCVSPGRNLNRGEHVVAAGNGRGIGVTIGSHAESSSKGGEAAAAEDGAERVQWARGKAGEDRVHVVVSEEHGWMFVGIYDGFNGPDATDYLVTNLYAAVCRELNGVLTEDVDPADRPDEQPPPRCNGHRGARDHEQEVLDALARGLKSTEAAFFAEAEARAAECPELAMMGSCVLVVLMKGADVYVMNVGDSRAVLAQRAEPDLSQVLVPRQDGGGGDLAGVKEEIMRQLDACDMGELAALQLTMDHSTNIYKEARRIKSEHLDDPACIVNGRVKGSLKVAQPLLKNLEKKPLMYNMELALQPRWNKALLEVFRVNYVGTSPYITCRPYLRHHRLNSRDKFMILSSDGLYDYFTNEEVVAQVEAFTARYPDEDPAKYLSHEILLRAANQAGMEFHELLEIQQGDRRQYHDDVSIIIISLEGKIWRS
ncbi:putative protein phosphatase 2C 46 [Dichanthelium oligosanthes]|uniref:protein-serine/threonine phosphatase n=1 Tax=Dichanthelium oligosanthes TaxID=888268 RepID=A0A1E5V067_9POAL|nr:putative protein phosphatase 2C 46 [Dichanthelium oligosanthes]